MSPFQSGAAFPAAQNSTSCSGSYEPVIQVGPPPYFHESPAQVSTPFSPSPGTVNVRHLRSPVLTSYASTYPRTPYSPPAMPTITLSFTTSGATVELKPSAYLSSTAFHTTLPVFRSKATSRASSVAINTLSSAIATPRLVGPQQIRKSSGNG